MPALPCRQVRRHNLFCEHLMCHVSAWAAVRRWRDRVQLYKGANATANAADTVTDTIAHVLSHTVAYPEPHAADSIANPAHATADACALPSHAPTYAVAHAACLPQGRDGRRGRHRPSCRLHGCVANHGAIRRPALLPPAERCRALRLQRHTLPRGRQPSGDALLRAQARELGGGRPRPRTATLLHACARQRR